MTANTSTKRAQNRSEGSLAPPVDLGRPPPIPRADLDRLLRAYSAVLVLVLDPPPSVTAPNWLPANRLITQALVKFRPSFARSTFLVRHIQRNVSVIERAYSRRLATGQRDDNDEQELELIRHFTHSLPPAPPRWFAVSAVIATILLAQALFSVLGSYPALGLLPIDQLDLKLTSIASPDATSLYDLAGKLVHANSYQLGMFVQALSLACYVVLRGPISGLRTARMLLNAPRALTRRNRNSPLAVQAKHWNVYGEEQRLLGMLRQSRPHDPPLDLLVKAALLAAPWFFCVAGGWYSPSALWDTLKSLQETASLSVVSPVVLLDAALFAVASAAAPPRLAWLSVAALRRRQGIALLTAVAAVSLVPIVAHSAPDDFNPDADTRIRAEQSQSLQALTNALGSAVWNDENGYIVARVRGVDLRGRNMNHMHLRGVDFQGAQLSDANLAFSNLADSCLQHAVLLNANLALADLRDADLRGADLRGANLHGAKLTNSGYDSQTKWPAGYPAGSGSLRARRNARSRCNTELFNPSATGRHWANPR